MKTQKLTEHDSLAEDNVSDLVPGPEESENPGLTRPKNRDPSEAPMFALT